MLTSTNEALWFSLIILSIESVNEILSGILNVFLPDTLSVTHYSDDDANTVHFKVNSCCLKARNVQVRVQVRRKPDSGPTRLQVQDSSLTTLLFSSWDKHIH